MKCNVTPVALLLALCIAPKAAAGNGSNYIHLVNGADYFFSIGPTNGAFRGVWQCFSGENLIAPTLVTDPLNPSLGTYAAKVCAIHFSVGGSVGQPVLFPTIALSTGSGGCKFTQSAGAALNFGLMSSAIGNIVIAGPINHNLGRVALQVVIPNVTMPTAPLSLVTQLSLSLTRSPGSPSSIPVPEGDSMTLWLQEDPGQTVKGNRQYWYG